jgi:hypothetical protein
MTFPRMRNGLSNLPRTLGVETLRILAVSIGLSVLIVVLVLWLLRPVS